MRYYVAERTSYKSWSVLLRDDQTGKIVKTVKEGFRVRMDAVRWGRDNGIQFTSHSNMVEETEGHDAISFA